MVNQEAICELQVEISGSTSAFNVSRGQKKTVGGPSNISERQFKLQIHYQRVYTPLSVSTFWILFNPKNISKLAILEVPVLTHVTVSPELPPR